MPSHPLAQSLDRILADVALGSFHTRSATESASARPTRSEIRPVGVRERERSAQEGVTAWGAPDPPSRVVMCPSSRGGGQANKPRAWMSRPARQPTTVPLMRMNWRSRPTNSSMRSLASSASQRSTVVVMTLASSWP